MLSHWHQSTGEVITTLFFDFYSSWKGSGKLRDECLNGEIFYSLKEAQVVIEKWRGKYNTKRAQSALGYRPPAPPSVTTGEQIHLHSPWLRYKNSLTSPGLKPRPGQIRLRRSTRPSRPVPNSTKDCGSGEEKVSITCEMLAVPLMPDVALMSFETETDITGAKKPTLLKFGGGLVTLI